MSGSVSFDNLSSLMRTSESFGDLNAELNPLRGARGAASANSANSASKTEDSSSGSNGAGATNKPFGLGNCKTLYYYLEGFVLHMCATFSLTCFLIRAEW